MLFCWGAGKWTFDISRLQPACSDSIDPHWFIPHEASFSVCLLWSMAPMGSYKHPLSSCCLSCSILMCSSQLKVMRFLLWYWSGLQLWTRNRSDSFSFINEYWSLFFTIYELFQIIVIQRSLGQTVFNHSDGFSFTFCKKIQLLSAILMLSVIRTVTRVTGGLIKNSSTRWQHMAI